MISDRREDLLAELLAELDLPDGPSDDEAIVARLAVACARFSGGWQAAIDLRERGEATALRAASSALAETAADLEFTLGQGPAWDALAHRRPVLVADLAAEGRWPQAGPALATAGVRSMAAIPLQVGALTLGTLTLVHNGTARLSPSEVAELLELSGALTEVLLQRLAGDDEGPLPPCEPAAAATALVHQATGMVAVHLACDLADATVRLRAHAYRHGLPLAELAAAVMAGSVRLTP